MLCKFLLREWMIFLGQYYWNISKAKLQVTLVFYLWLSVHPVTLFKYQPLWEAFLSFLLYFFWAPLILYIHPSVFCIRSFPFCNGTPLSSRKLSYSLGLGWSWFYFYLAPYMDSGSRSGHSENPIPLATVPGSTVGMQLKLDQGPLCKFLYQHRWEK